MSDIRKAFERYAEPAGLLEGTKYLPEHDAYDWPTAQFAYHAWKAALQQRECARDADLVLAESTRRLAATNARIAELEALIADIKTWDMDKAAEEIARGQDLNLQVPPEIRKRMQAALDASPANAEARQ